MLDLTWLAAFPFMAGSMVALGYSSMLHYFALEVGMRPVLVDINQQGTPRTETGLSALPLRWRLLLTLPLINIITGLTVAALTSEPGGGARSCGSRETASPTVSTLPVRAMRSVSGVRRARSNCSV